VFCLVVSLADGIGSPFACIVGAGDFRYQIVRNRTIERQPKSDVLLDVIYSAICHSDIHHIYNDWNSNHPA
jgi:D-arabinose 1-dehydrogenase-like Zn-dependent alcohol dehydrogenase